MSCVVGLIEGGSVYMGADSAAVAGFDLYVRKDRKLFRRGEFLFGVSGSSRVQDRLRYGLVLPEHPVGMDAMEYLAVPFVDALRADLQAAGVGRKENEVEAMADQAALLVGYRGGLFTVFCDYQVAENHASYAAVGCGADFAVGALHALSACEERHPVRIPHLTPRGRLEVALTAAEQWSAGVRGPFIYASLEEE